MIMNDVMGKNREMGERWTPNWEDQSVRESEQEICTDSGANEGTLLIFCLCTPGSGFGLPLGEDPIPEGHKVHRP